MRHKLMWGIVLGVVIAAGVRYGDTVSATDSSGFVSTPIAMGRLGEIDVDNLSIFEDPSDANSKKNVWHSMQKTKGNSDLYVQSNVWAPGGTTGWHTHPGHSLITVTAGTVTAYEGDDPTCTPKLYSFGMTFVDPGGDHVHVLRNETAAEARTITVQLIPAGATRRIGTAGSPSCPF